MTKHVQRHIPTFLSNREGKLKLERPATRVSLCLTLRLARFVIAIRNRTSAVVVPGIFKRCFESFLFSRSRESGNGSSTRISVCVVSNSIGYSVPPVPVSLLLIPR